MDIEEALLTLDPENEDQWTSDGLPRVEVMQQLTENKDLTRQQITDADPEFCRDKAKVQEGGDAADTPPSPPVEEDAPPEDLPPGQDDTTEQEQKPPTKLELDEQINDLERERNKLTGQIVKLQRQRDRLQKQEATSHSHLADTQARLNYIHSQRKLRGTRAARGREVLKVLKKDELDPRSQLDQAMARKTKRGTQRPVRPTESPASTE